LLFLEQGSGILLLSQCASSWDAVPGVKARLPRLADPIVASEGRASRACVAGNARCDDDRVHVWMRGG
jgi:hypothetical protein